MKMTTSEDKDLQLSDGWRMLELPVPLEVLTTTDVFPPASATSSSSSSLEIGQEEQKS